MKRFFDHQEKFIDEVVNEPFPQRACLYFKTGSGKSLAAMQGMKELGQTEVLVIAPPSTHKEWQALADHVGVIIRTLSHAKFRMPDTKLSRKIAVIADEFHMFGGHHGKGWKKLEMLAKGLQAPLFLLSATPNYNDAERVYCVHRLLSPQATKGGYLQWLYQNCHTQQNRFSMTPDVTGFKDYPDAAAFLADLPRVWYLADDLVYDIEDVEYDENLPNELTEFRYNWRKHRIMASQMEMRHTARYQGLVGWTDHVRPEVMDLLLPIIDRADGPVMIYCNHSTVAQALARTLDKYEVDCLLITGLTTKQNKDLVLEAFKQVGGILIGTASIATGTDGLDRVCDTLIILDDTDDDALRRQLIGRIMPRGAPERAVAKKVLRFVPA